MPSKNLLDLKATAGCATLLDFKIGYLTDWLLRRHTVCSATPFRSARRGGPYKLEKHYAEGSFCEASFFVPICLAQMALAGI